jgi:hypothetical protein
VVSLAGQGAARICAVSNLILSSCLQAFGLMALVNMLMLGLQAILTSDCSHSVMHAAASSASSTPRGPSR